MSFILCITHSTKKMAKIDPSIGEELPHIHAYFNLTLFNFIYFHSSPMGRALP